MVWNLIKEGKNADETIKLIQKKYKNVPESVNEEFIYILEIL